MSRDFLRNSSRRAEHHCSTSRRCPARWPVRIARRCGPSFVFRLREPDAAMVPGVVRVESMNRSGPWTHRGRDLDTEEEIVEMVTRQYVDVGQDDLLAPYFNFGPGFIDWQAHIRTVADYWCHVLLYAPGYEIDVIESHRHLHDRAPFTPDLFDRWLRIFHDTVNGGWTGPKATTATKRDGVGHGTAVPRPWGLAPRRPSLTGPSMRTEDLTR